MTDIPAGAAYAPGLTSGPAGSPDEILVAFAEPAHQNRLTVLARIILAIPHLVVLWALGIAAEIVVIICWFAALFLGRLPEGLAGFLTGYLRWLVRVQAYLFLVTATYPWGLFGDHAPPPAAGTGWLGGNEPWRLVLSSGAKVLVGMFLAIGVLVAAGYGALIGVAASTSNTTTTASAGSPHASAP